MRRIWVYQGDFGWGKDFRWTSLTEFRRSFSVQQAVGYLGAIQHALRRDAKEGYREGQFNISLRHAFAEIDGVAKLYCGERGKRDTAQHAVEFGEKYLGRVNPRYRELFGLVFNMYRHGLAHTHLTMCVRFRGGRHRWVTLGWGMSDDDCHRNRHLTIERRETHFFRIWLHVPRFVDDALQAIDFYASDPQKRGKRSRLFSRFKRGYEGTASVVDEPSAPMPPTSNPGKGKRKKSLALNAYSRDGVDFVKREIASQKTWTEPPATGG